MINTLKICVSTRLYQSHELRLHALAAVEQRRAYMQRTHLSWLHIATPQQPMHRRERHRRCVLVLAAGSVAIREQPTCLQSLVSPHTQRAHAVVRCVQLERADAYACP